MAQQNQLPHNFGQPFINQFLQTGDDQSSSQKKDLTPNSQYISDQSKSDLQDLELDKTIGQYINGKHNKYYTTNFIYIQKITKEVRSFQKQYQDIQKAINKNIEVDIKIFKQSIKNMISDFYQMQFEQKLDILTTNLQLFFPLEKVNLIKLDPIYKCKTCGKQFGQSRALGGHVARKHQNKEKPEIIKQKRVRNQTQLYQFPIKKNKDQAEIKKMKYTKNEEYLQQQQKKILLDEDQQQIIQENNKQVLKHKKIKKCQ